MSDAYTDCWPRPEPLSREEVLFAAIKKHHDQKADDRCHLDDNELYAAAGLEPGDNTISDPAAMLENCKRFIECRMKKGRWPTYQQLEERVAEMMAEIKGAVALIPQDCQVAVREGGGGENYYATFCVSLMKLVDSRNKERQEFADCYKQLTDARKQMEMDTECIERIRNHGMQLEVEREAIKKLLYPDGLNYEPNLALAIETMLKLRKEARTAEQWTHDRPKRPGWYWCRNIGDRPNETWEAPVRIDFSTSGLICTWLEAPGRAAQSEESFWEATTEWLGPIAPLQK